MSIVIVCNGIETLDYSVKEEHKNFDGFVSAVNKLFEDETIIKKDEGIFEYPVFDIENDTVWYLRNAAKHHLCDADEKTIEQNKRILKESGYDVEFDLEISTGFITKENDKTVCLDYNSYELS